MEGEIADQLLQSLREAMSPCQIRSTHTYKLIVMVEVVVVESGVFEGLFERDAVVFQERGCVEPAAVS